MRCIADVSTCDLTGDYSILSRGLLLPAAVTKLGVKRTDFGWLGAGIYFGCVVNNNMFCDCFCDVFYQLSMMIIIINFNIDVLTIAFQF